MSDKPQPILIDDDGFLQTEKWPQEALVEPDFLRSDRVRRENDGFGVYAVRGSAVYREVPRRAEDGAKIRLQLLRYDPGFVANGGPLMDDQVSPNAATPTIAPLDIETNPATAAVIDTGPYAGPNTTELAQSKLTGGGITGPTRTVSDAELQAAHSGEAGYVPPQPDGTAPVLGTLNADSVRNAAQTRDDFAQPQPVGSQSMDVESRSQFDGGRQEIAQAGAPLTDREVPFGENDTTRPAEDMQNGEGMPEEGGEIEATDAGDGGESDEESEQKGGEGAEISGFAGEQQSDEPSQIERVEQQADQSDQPSAIGAQEDGTTNDGDVFGEAETNPVPLTESEEVPEYTVQHRGRGSYSVLDATGEEAVQGLSKSEADKVRNMNAIDRAEYVRAADNQAAGRTEGGDSEG